MKVRNLPIVGTVSESGADDHVYDGLLLAGPFVVLSIAVLGRSVVTEVLAVAFLVVFVGYVLYRGFDRLIRAR
ncbi:MAG: hypothetical protein ACOCR6_02955 [archaeon]